MPLRVYIVLVAGVECHQAPHEFDEEGVPVLRLHYAGDVLGLHKVFEVLVQDHDPILGPGIGVVV